MLGSCTSLGIFRELIHLLFCLYFQGCLLYLCVSTIGDSVFSKHPIVLSLPTSSRLPIFSFLLRCWISHFPVFLVTIWAFIQNFRLSFTTQQFFSSIFDLSLETPSISSHFLPSIFQKSKFIQQLAQFEAKYQIYFLLFGVLLEEFLLGGIILHLPLQLVLFGYFFWI